MLFVFLGLNQTVTLYSSMLREILTRNDRYALALIIVRPNIGTVKPEIKTRLCCTREILKDCDYSFSHQINVSSFFVFS